MTIWMNQEDIINKLIRRPNTEWFHLYEVFKYSNSETAEQWLPQAGGGRNKNCSSVGIRFYNQLMQEKQFLPLCNSAC